ncbi:L-ascorbate metabolism protein UlaG (beta-lactamase superfamily) [Rhodobacter sp. JA431]|nr:L-ascorbate metabolism protein UlaG (beta-lactamase superfamily) [Rhodobacter sp. JA431]
MTFLAGRSYRRLVGTMLMTLMVAGCEQEAEGQQTGNDGEETVFQLSDHFDGERFINPTLEDQVRPGLRDVFGMISEGRPSWPDKVANTATPRLDHDLGVNGMAVTFVNHATFLIQLPGLTILTDPVWSDRVSPVSWFGPKRVRAPGIDFDALPEVDVVLISHNHYDHLDLPTLRKLNARFSPQFYVPLGNRTLLHEAGIMAVTELDWWQDVVAASGVRIVLTPAQHSSGRGLRDRDRSLWGSYYITRGSRSLFFGGDSGYSSQFTEIRETLGAPEVALLGMGAYEPRWFMKPLHMNPVEALMAHRDLRAGYSIGMHFGTFQLASEEFQEPVEDLARALAEDPAHAERFVIMREGDVRLFPRERADVGE